MTSLLRRYIIEHPRRGVLIVLDYTDTGNQLGKFSPTASRTEGMVFNSQLGAENARAKIRPHKLRAECQVRQEPTPQEVKDWRGSGDIWKIVA
jgi:hypothetical protein